MGKKKKKVHDADLKAPFVKKEINSVVVFFPEGICPFTLKGNFCVLEVQPS